jgi:hypothetical protein
VFDLVTNIATYFFYPFSKDTGVEGESDFGAEGPAREWMSLELKSNDQLTPTEIIAMPLSEFVERFGFQPVDKLEKHWFAVNAKRLGEMERAALEAGIIGDLPDLSKVGW